MNLDDIARRKLLGILAGSWQAQAVFALVSLGIPDLLGDSASTVDDLTAATGADRSALSRLLRALSLLGLLAQPSPDTYALTSTTALLRSDHPDTVAPNVLMQGDEIFQSFAQIMHTMRTGRPAFEKIYGLSFYDYLEERPAAAAIFESSMGNQPTPSALFKQDLSRVSHLVDLGGGNGSLLGDFLTRHPNATGTLVELPAAIRAARSHLPASLLDRITLIEADLFTAAPPPGDAYVLSHVLHNWPDERCLDLLSTLHTHLAPSSILIVLEDFLPPPDAPALRKATAAFGDLLMLVTLPGRDRTEAEYASLLSASGFSVDSVHHADDGSALVSSPHP